MLNLLWLVPVLPFFSFLILALFGKKFPIKASAVLGAGSIGLSALLTLIIGIGFISNPPENFRFVQTFWTWFNVAGLNPSISFYLDPLSIVFIFVITFVGFLIHLYSIEFMYEEEGFSRFFAYMNLFVGSMLTLVLADNLLLLYLGWEGVGLCSFLLIGFWYKDPANGAAAQKAFIVTRIGDTAMAIGLFLLVANLGTLNINEILTKAPAVWPQSSGMATAAALLLLGGALGKSAQLPLQTWLPDAMAGPSPVSALIHAATMVTAGVYLIARTNALFILAPQVQMLIAIIGAATLLVAGFSALAQHDIKRVLAYSTISQIGYMFLALGVGAFSAAIFHFMIHAFFKALLFLAAGAVILSLHHEHNIFKMGGIKNKMPLIYWTFLIGSASLASLPLITAGFYSKDMILWFAWSSPKGSAWLWAAGLFGAFITAIYTFRLIFITFFGTQKTEIGHTPGKLIKVPLVILAVLSLIGGFIELPGTLGNLPLFSGFVEKVLPSAPVHGENILQEGIFQAIAAITALLGFYIAYLLYLRRTPSEGKNLLQKFFYSGWGFDWLYERIFVRPIIFLAKINKNDFIDLIYTGIAAGIGLFHGLLIKTQTGKLRWYAMGIAAGAVITLTIIVFL
ncbi:MAG TPA: NADH-quinone oxidoreductase subunit L [Ignavibacteriaceae bacterium]|nr:NADH-quinone oxidoreductase subunit L [Ignavibacteriaceae bacterium]